MNARALPLRERLERARRVTLVFGRVYLRLRAQRFIARRIRPPDLESRWEETHETNAREIYDAAVSLQGLILKGCQFASARADLLPPAYSRVLGQLQDRVPPHGFGVVRRQVERELCRPLENVFTSFEEEPLAAASLAQVHAARLRDGTEVAVKVQYPEIATLVHSDLTNLRALFRAVGWLERDFDLMPLVEELGVNVPRELDFRSEARNAERIRDLLAGREDLVIPQIHHGLTTRRLLVMERIDGVKITEAREALGARADLPRLMRGLIEIFAEMILVHGFFHADPHPGNLMVERGSGRLVLLDFGLAKELPARFREKVLAFATALLQGEEESMGQALIALGFETRDGRAESLHEIAALLLRIAQEIRREGRVHPQAWGRLREELPARIRENPIVRIPHHLVLVGRVLSLLVGLNAELGVRVDFLRALLPYAMGVAKPPRSCA